MIAGSLAGATPIHNIGRQKVDHVRVLPCVYLDVALVLVGVVPETASCRCSTAVEDVYKYACGYLGLYIVYGKIRNWHKTKLNKAHRGRTEVDNR